jgi:hypothetical protein
VEHWQLRRRLQGLVQLVLPQWLHQYQTLLLLLLLPSWLLLAILVGQLCQADQ